MTFRQTVFLQDWFRHFVKQFFFKIRVRVGVWNKVSVSKTGCFDTSCHSEASEIEPSSSALERSEDNESTDHTIGRGHVSRGNMRLNTAEYTPYSIDL